MARCDVRVPDDLVIQIILWLPVISLVRFKGVCKSWCGLIESSSFTVKHLHRATLKEGGGGNVIVKHCRPHPTEREKETFFLLSGKSSSSFERVNLDLGFPYMKEDYPVEIRIVGSCNGIICLRRQPYLTIGGHLVLWNPATRELKLLPESRIRLAGAPPYFGFEFDAKTNDLKVIKIGWTKKGIGGNTPRRVEVYSVRSNSWRLSEARLPIRQIMYSTPAHLNGIYYWWGIHHTFEDTMVSFNMTNEVFQTTPMPETDVTCDDDKDGLWRSFSVLNQSVALFIFPCNAHVKCTEIWVFNHNHNHGCGTDAWSKLYKIGPLPARPSAFSKNGELFIECNGQLQLCDPVTQEIKSLQVDVLPASLAVFSYTETLFSLNTSN